MTVTASLARSLAPSLAPSPAVPSPGSGAEDRYVVLSEPRPGTIVELTPGSQLAVRFRRGLGPSRWHVAGLPGHLLVLGDGGGHEFQFLVFGAEADAAPVRFERRHPEREMVSEVCELLVLPVSERPARGAAGGSRRSRSASPRTA